MYQISYTVDQVIVALADFIRPFVPDLTPIVRSQVNRVPMPPDVTVVLTELLQVDIETPTSTYNYIDELNISNPKRIDIQIDFYGDKSADYCAAVKTVFRSEYSVNNFPPGIAPLYCGDGIQSPLITAEQQWESRWTLTATLQYNPEISVTQQFADNLSIDQFVDVEVEYPN